MTNHWYYSHAGLTHGPFSMEEIKERAAQKMLVESDLLWQGGSEGSVALARAAIRFADLKASAPSKIDWLEDVARLECKGPVPGPFPGDGLPEWLDDLRLWYGLEIYKAIKSTPQASASAPLTIAVPVWLEDWLFPKKPANETAIRARAARTRTAPIAQPMARIKTKLDSIAAQAIAESGFDPRTGRIQDPEQFNVWRKAARTKKTAVDNESLFEVFRKARIAIENWVDDDSRRPLILSGDMARIKNDAALVAVFQQYQGYGAALREKLEHHLEFMVENRRKFYAAAHP